jgi:anti-sigma B factor antagonist
MTINKTKNGDTTTLALSGRLDSITSDQLSDELGQVFMAGATNLVLDFHSLDYISSAGLRVIIMMQKKVSALGTKMELTGMNETVREVFDITGFSQILTIR